MRTAARRIVLSAALLAVACSGADRVSQGYPGEVGGGIDHERFTRGARIYENLETAAIVGATLLAPALDAHLAALIAAETPALGPRDAIGFDLDRERAAAVVILSSQRQAWERLKPPSTPWSLTLTTGAGEPLQPAAITALDPGPSFERYFPAWNLWARAWLVEFPLPATALEGPVSLDVRAAGGLGARLDWR